MMRWLLFICPLVAAIGLWAWRARFQTDEPDLCARYRAAWDIPNDEIRRAR